jgi:KDO2-lipid IV(A) lauroyltransferase
VTRQPEPDATTPLAPDAVAGGRGTRAQRLRARVIASASAAVSLVPESSAIAAADSLGEIWYRATPARAAVARANLRRVCLWLAAEGRGPARARRAATDPAALESLVRSAYRQAARYYLELLRASRLDDAYVAERLEALTPDVLADASAEARGIILLSGHLGPIELPAYVAARMGRGRPVGVMEAVDDPELQRWFASSRSGTGIRLVGLGDARRELGRALDAGGTALIVADRDITGGGTEIPLFGHPAPLPSGPALLAIDSGARVFFIAMWRTRPGRYRAWMREIDVPADGRLRERATAILTSVARAIEDGVAEAPEQWWAVFFPIWADLAPAERAAR